MNDKEKIRILRAAVENAAQWIATAELLEDTPLDSCDCDGASIESVTAIGEPGVSQDRMLEMLVLALKVSK